MGLLSLGLTACGGRPQYRDSAETLVTADGVTLVAHAYVPPVETSPGLVLLHRAGGDRHVWDGFATRAQQSGYRVLALDLRGQGESRSAGDSILDFRQFSDDDWRRASLDIDAALQRLKALGAAPDDLFLVGEGFGANLALHYATEHPEIQGVVLLSPGAEYHGIEVAPLIHPLRTRPLLLLWGQRDDYAAACATTIQQLAEGHLEIRVYPGGAQGADLFATAPEAMGQVLVWLDQMLASPPAPAT